MSQDDGEIEKRDRICGGIFGKIGRVKFRSGCMVNNTVRRTGILLVELIVCSFPDQGSQPIIGI